MSRCLQAMTPMKATKGGSTQRRKRMADLISRKALVTKLSQGYWDRELQKAKNDPCVIDAMIDWAIRIVKEMPLESPWHTGTPPFEEIDKDNQYCYALCFYYYGWWLSDYLFKANHEEGCFENSPNNGQQVCKFKFCETIAWRKIEPYKED